jgi:hypothetical protein
MTTPSGLPAENRDFSGYKKAKIAKEVLGAVHKERLAGIVWSSLNLP